MKNLKIGKKLGISFIVIILLAAFGNFYSITNLRKAGNLSQELFEGPYELTSQAMGIRRDLVTIARTIGKSIIEKDATEARNMALVEFDSINERLSIVVKCLDGETEVTTEFENSMKDLRSACEEVFGAIEIGDYDRAVAITDNNTKYMNSYNNSAELAIKLYEDARTRGNEFNSDVKKTVSQSTTFSIVVSVVSIVSGIGMCLYITRLITKPIEELEIAANKMSEGDFDIVVSYESSDELGSLSNSMKQMSNNINDVIKDTVEVLGEVSTGNFNTQPKVEYIGIFSHIEDSIVKITNDLSETISQINVSSEEVGAAADQVANGSQMLSQGATEQASAIQELSATITEISEKVQNTAENAKKANDLTLNSAKQVNEGNEQMKQMVNAMEEISFTSNEIGRIIKTIDDIAFQTNILALNAAVEAARAGVAGKGFAVVADEVRNLAAKSAEAAKNTAVLIENSIYAVEKGTSIVDNTAKSLSKIINTTNRTTKLVDEIAKASEEQAGAINQVTLGVEQVSAVVQTNSATSEESAASSEELSGQAQMLRSLIEHFKLKDVDYSKKDINFNNEEDSFFSMNEF